MRSWFTGLCRPALWLGASALCASFTVFAQDRVALVIGNSAYPRAPLYNPTNDARDMGALLRKAGFKVLGRNDATKAQMEASIAEFGAAITQPNVKLAVFYYAGHGVQMQWRNYLVPVDAAPRSADDMRNQSTDVSALLAYMQRAQQKGRSFLIVLDACRDDPFAGSYRAEAKGLSQFDAPSGSLLAYSTSPGRVAADAVVGGANGLYTAYLLKELDRRGAPIEDAFKRTRLNVRMASNGQQNPWESTSLEEDVFLFPGEAPRKLTEKEQDERFEGEMRAWREVKDSEDPHKIAAFLREHPSGSVSELAQSRLNRVLGSQSGAESARLVAKNLAVVESRAAQEARDKALVEQQQLMEVARVAREQALLEAQRMAAVALAAERTEAARREAERLALEQIQNQAAQERLGAARAAAERQRVEAARVEAARVQAVAAEAARLAQAALARAAQEAAAKADAARVVAQAAVQVATLAAQRVLETDKPAVAAERVVLPTTPYFQGGNDFVRSYAVGDKHSFRIMDGFNRADQRPLEMEVTKVDERADRVEFNNGDYVSDLMGNILANLRGTSSTPRQFYPAELFVGKRWKTEFKQDRPNGVSYTFRYTMRVVGKERITVPAGTFDAFKIEGRGFNLQLGADIHRVFWVAHGISADIAMETRVTLRNGRVDQYDRQELVAYQAKPPMGR